jgi:hypothetical protein
MAKLFSYKTFTVPKPIAVSKVRKQVFTRILITLILSISLLLYSMPDKHERPFSVGACMARWSLCLWYHLNWDVMRMRRQPLFALSSGWCICSAIIYITVLSIQHTYAILYDFNSFLLTFFKGTATRDSCLFFMAYLH